MSFRIVVLISGSGTTLRNLIQVQQQGRLAAEIVHVISSRSDATGLDHARNAGIAYTVVDSRLHSGVEVFSDAIFKVCRDAKSDLVVMGGFLKRVLIPDDFVNRVINIHPSLIPAFCGHGMYGLHVHSAVIKYGCKLSGCTVHFVDNEYDHGPIIAQQPVPVLVDDTPQSLAGRVFQRECELYPDVINTLARGTVSIQGRVVCP